MRRSLALSAGKNGSSVLFFSPLPSPPLTFWPRLPALKVSASRDGHFAAFSFCENLATDRRRFFSFLSPFLSQREKANGVRLFYPSLFLSFFLQDVFYLRRCDKFFGRAEVFLFLPFFFFFFFLYSGELVIRLKGPPSSDPLLPSPGCGCSDQVSRIGTLNIKRTPAADVFSSSFSPPSPFILRPYKKLGKREGGDAVLSTIPLPLLFPETDQLKFSMVIETGEGHAAPPFFFLFHYLFSLLKKEERAFPVPLSLSFLSLFGRGRLMSDLGLVA